MKKILSFAVFAAMMLTVSVSLTACGGDDDDEPVVVGPGGDQGEPGGEDVPTSKDVNPVGYWRVTETRLPSSQNWKSAEMLTMTLSFEEDGDYAVFVRGTKLVGGKYKVSGRKISVTLDGETSDVYYEFPEHFKDETEVVYYSGSWGNPTNNYRISRTVNPLPDTFDPTGRWMATHFRSVSNATWEPQPDNLETYVWFEADKSYAGLLNGLQLSKGTYSVDGRKIRVKLSGGTQSQMEVDYVVDENTIEVVLYDADFKKAQGLQRLKRIHYPKTLEQAEEIFLGQWRVPDSELGMAFDEGYLDFVSLSEMRAVFHVKSNAAGSDKWYTPYKGRYVGYVASTACGFKYDAADMTGMFIYYSSGSQMPLFTLNSLCDRSFLMTENGSKEAMLMIRPAEPVKYTLIDKPE